MLIALGVSECVNACIQGVVWDMLQMQCNLDQDKAVSEGNIDDASGKSKLPVERLSDLQLIYCGTV